MRSCLLDCTESRNRSAGRFLTLILILLAVHVAHAAGLSQVTLANTTPLSGNTELARRMLSPLTAFKVRQALARSGNVLGDQPINPSSESFVVYVPSKEPSNGFGLLV
jgi:hypothetical protein